MHDAYRRLRKEGSARKTCHEASRRRNCAAPYVLVDVGPAPGHLRITFALAEASRYKRRWSLCEFWPVESRILDSFKWRSWPSCWHSFSFHPQQEEHSVGRWIWRLCAAWELTKKKSSTALGHLIPTSFSNPRSSRIATPNSFALSYFDPGSVPTTT